MTVTVTTSRIAYTTDGVSKTFAIPWLFYLDADIVAYLGNSTVPLVLGSDYSLAGKGTPAGGTLTTLALLAYSAGQNLTIVEAPALTQPSHFVSNQAFPSATVEQTYDRAIVLPTLSSG